MAASSSESQFDDLGAAYESADEWPFREEIEFPSVLHALGNLTRCSVLDYGCGSGLYARLLKSRGAARVVGYDQATGMLRHARKLEEERPQGIEYTSELSASLRDPFDLVVGVYVLPYATTRTALEAMCKEMASVLRPGGRLMTPCLNPDYDPSVGYYRPYGFCLVADEPHVDGAPVRLDLFHSSAEASVTACYWSRASMERALEAAGFTSVKWKAVWPPSFSRIEEAPPWMEAYLRKPHAILLDCQLG
ncbi:MULTISPECIES: class I SAM-dependent methyltransferase [Myxococcus]|uniref:class I SAM-dependent methyltransferase n=1 Tax=Myxococcus TaxID=32 RepID=UPI0013D06297|nr:MULTISPECIES: class I SAM-dependent methyltransferase [Myxococcus]NVJ22262.1 methyltransferase domain-containing protein [Myxococcus sp. AM011]